MRKATRTQQVSDFVQSHVRGLAYFGWLPERFCPRQPEERREEAGPI